MENTIRYVAMDTHKKQHKVALHYRGDEQIVQSKAFVSANKGLNSLVAKTRAVIGTFLAPFAVFAGFLLPKLLTAGAGSR